MDRRGFVASGAVASFAILAFILASPYLAQPGAYTGLDGTPSLIDHGWKGTTDIMYLLGDILCHQETGRSFILNGSQLPFCMRDVALLSGFCIGMIACTLIEGLLPDRRVAYIGTAMASVTAIEWLLEWSLGDMPVLRVSTGVVSGAGVSLFLCWMLYRETGETGRQCV